MFELGDRMTEISIQKDRIEMEQQQIMDAQDNGEEIDEARKLEIENEIEELDLE